jgi:hypothetical protein
VLRMQVRGRLTRAEVCLLTQQIGGSYAGRRKLFSKHYVARRVQQSLSQATIFSLLVRIL